MPSKLSSKLNQSNKLSNQNLDFVLGNHDDFQTEEEIIPVVESCKVGTPIYLDHGVSRSPDGHVKSIVGTHGQSHLYEIQFHNGDIDQMPREHFVAVRYVNKIFDMSYDDDRLALDNKAKLVQRMVAYEESCTNILSSGTTTPSTAESSPLDFGTSGGSSRDRDSGAIHAQVTALAAAHHMLLLTVKNIDDFYNSQAAKLIPASSSPTKSQQNRKHAKRRFRGRVKSMSVPVLRKCPQKMSMPYDITASRIFVPPPPQMGSSPLSHLRRSGSGSGSGEQSFAARRQASGMHSPGSISVDTAQKRLPPAHPRTRELQRRESCTSHTSLGDPYPSPSALFRKEVTPKTLDDEVGRRAIKHQRRNVRLQSRRDSFVSSDGRHDSGVSNCHSEPTSPALPPQSFTPGGFLPKPGLVRCKSTGHPVQEKIHQENARVRCEMR